MAGVGEVSAIFGLVAISFKLSKAIHEASHAFNDSQSQIWALGDDVRTLGNVLEQTHSIFASTLDETTDGAVLDVLGDVVEQCDSLFSQISAFSDKLQAASSLDNGRVSLRSRLKYKFKNDELVYMQRRLESMKTNLLLMLTLELTKRFEEKSDHILL